MAKKSEAIAIGSMYVEHKRVPFDNGDGVSMTRQEFAEECDINALMERYDKAGVWPMHPNMQAVPQYLDLTEMPDNLMGTLEMMRAAETSFMSLPAVVRREFDNDAAKFVDYAADAANIERMREWGLAPPLEQEPPPQKVEVVNPVQPVSS